MNAIRIFQVTMVPTFSQKHPRSVAFLLFTILIVLIALITSCKDTIQDTKPPDIVFPDSLVSYSRHVESLWSQACAHAGCHAGQSPAGGLSLERPSYRSVIDYPTLPLVIQRDGTHSVLVMILDGRASPPMPPRNRPQLTLNQINGVKRWIDEGALNN
jgi:hypothetical protein